MKKNNIVISGYYGFSNAGDEAMLFAVLRALHYDPKRMRITVISGDPRRTENTFRVHAVSRFDGYSILKKCLSIRFVNQRRRKPASGCDKLEKHDVLPEYYRDGNIFPKESISLLPRNRTGQISLGTMDFVYSNEPC